MRILYSRTLWVLVFSILFLSKASAQVVPGQIIRKCYVDAGRDILDPDSNVVKTGASAPYTSYTSATTAGFGTPTNPNDDVTTSEIRYKPLPPYSLEPFGDLRRGPDHAFTDFVPGVDNASYYLFFNTTQNALQFRMRLGSVVPGAKGYSLLIDTDGKFGATGTNADPNYKAATTGIGGNPGFEIEIVLATGGGNDGILVYNVDGTDNPVLSNSYTNWLNYSQLSIAGTNDNGDPDLYMDFYVPFAALQALGVSATTPIRMIPTTVMAPKAAIGGPKSDIYGLDDDLFKDPNAEYEKLLGAMPPFKLDDFSSTTSYTSASSRAMCTAAPTLNTPISTPTSPATTVNISGTWARSDLSGAASTATIYIYVNGIKQAQTATVTSTGNTVTWTVPGVTVTDAQTVYATAKASTESECLSSNSVAVSKCNSANKPATPVLSCTTFQKGLSGTNRGSTNGVLWTVHVDNVSTNDLRNSTSNQTNAYFSNLTGSNWDFSNGCSTGSQMPAGSYKIYYTDNTGCNSEPLFICVDPGKSNTGVAGTLAVPTITYPVSAVFTPAIKSISGTTQATAAGTSMTLYIDNYPVATTTSSASSPYSFSFNNLNLLQGQKIYITSEYNSGASSTSYCQNKTALSTVTCFTGSPTITTNVAGDLIPGAAITGTSSEPAGTTIKVYVTTNTTTPVATVTVQSNGTWTTGAVTAASGSSYYATAQNGTCGVSSQTASFLAPSTVTSGRCGTISPTSLTPSTTSLTVTLASAVNGTIVNLYEDGNLIATATTNAATWTPDVSRLLYSGGVLTIGIKEPSKAEQICPTSYPVSCTQPTTPLITPSVSTIQQNKSQTYTITNPVSGLFYGIADANTGSSLAKGVWASSGTQFSITTDPIPNPGTVSVVVKATSMSSTEMCSVNSAPASLAVTITPLPLNLVELNGHKLDNIIVLKWATANEINTSHFEIERSQNGVSFTKIGQVAVSGRSQDNYVFNDNQPLTGPNYYRLKMVDMDGKFTYSKVIVVNMDTTSILSAVWPNPFLYEINMDAFLRESEKVVIKLLSENGSVLKSKEILGRKGANLWKLETPKTLAPGVYILQLQTNTGVSQQKLIRINN